MSILNDATIEEINAENTENLAADLDNAADQAQLNQNYSGLPHFDFGFLKAPTGEGSIEDYTEHVLNPEHSKGIAQMLRGFTGLAGNLNLAILDILFGGFAYMKENKKNIKVKAAPEEKKESPLNEQPIINV